MTKKNKILCSLFLIVCASVISCKQSNNNSLQRHLREFVGTEITIPESLLLFNDTNHYIREDVKYKLVFYVDSLSCTQCFLNAGVVTWANLMNKFESRDFNLVIVFHSQDIEVLQELFKTYNLDIPFFIDFYGDFEESNNLPSERMLHTFLLKDNTVVLAGDPSNNPKLLQLYEKEIAKN